MKFPLVLCLLCPLVQVAFHSVQGWQAFKNDATEIIPELSEHPEPPPDLSNSNNKTMNRAENGGRYPHHPLEPKDASDYSCRELHFTRYITDGPCRSAKPVTELVCSGQCGPAHLQPNAIGRKWLWRQSAADYRCIPDRYRTQRIQLLCPGGEEPRTHKVRVVLSCKCKRYTRFHNQSELKDFGKEAARPPKNKKPRLSRTRSGKAKQPELENAY